MPKKTATTISDVRELGYQVGFAHGSVDAEHEALEQAYATAEPEALARQTETVTRDTIRDLAEAGQLNNKTPEQRMIIASRIAESALDHLTTHANERVEFHERALRAAKEMPDVFVVNGPGVMNLYVACKPDGSGWDENAQVILDALVDAAAHKERVKQHQAGEG